MLNYIVEQSDVIRVDLTVSMPQSGVGLGRRTPSPTGYRQINRCT